MATKSRYVAYSKIINKKQKVKTVRGKKNSVLSRLKEMKEQLN